MHKHRIAEVRQPANAPKGNTDRVPTEGERHPLTYGACQWTVRVLDCFLTLCGPTGAHGAYIVFKDWNVLTLAISSRGQTRCLRTAVDFIDAVAVGTSNGGKSDRLCTAAVSCESTIAGSDKCGSTAMVMGSRMSGIAAGSVGVRGWHGGRSRWRFAGDRGQEPNAIIVFPFDPAFPQPLLLRGPTLVVLDHSLRRPARCCSATTRFQLHASRA
ncbi:hypothetical protein BC628DRAFT_1126413 [Trametes gibbosa]|nr:hypothetical protein BC628DRAFT_1126413 [Trametes gibbosa]